MRKNPSSAKWTYANQSLVWRVKFTSMRGISMCMKSKTQLPTATMHIVQHTALIIHLFPQGGGHYFTFCLPMFQPLERNHLTILGVTAAVSGTRKKMRDLCTP